MYNNILFDVDCYPLESALCFKIFEKMHAIRSTGTFRRQKFGLFHLKFSVEFNELSVQFLKHKGVAKKWPKLK